MNKAFGIESLVIGAYTSGHEDRGDSLGDPDSQMSRSVGKGRLAGPVTFARFSFYSFLL